MCVCGSEKDLEFYVATPCGRGKQCGGDFTRRCGRHDTTDMYSIQGLCAILIFYWITVYVCRSH